MSEKIQITTEINKDLYFNVKDSLDMSFDDFIEFSLQLFVHSDDEYSRLFKNACKKQAELNKIKEKLYLLDNRNKNSKQDYTQALETVNRIHHKLGYIGKNQLRKIANNNNLNQNEFIRYVEKNQYNVTNFGDSPKKR